MAKLEKNICNCNIFSINDLDHKNVWFDATKYPGDTIFKDSLSSTIRNTPQLSNIRAREKTGLLMVEIICAKSIEQNFTRTEFWRETKCTEIAFALCNEIVIDSAMWRIMNRPIRQEKSLKFFKNNEVGLCNVKLKF